MDVTIAKIPDPECDTFLKNRPDATICHTYQWADAVARAARLKAFYLVARDTKGVHGVLPLTQAKSRLFGNFMVSQAFSNYGGLLADSPEARDALFNHAVELAGKLNCESIEFRNVQPLPFNLELRSDKMCMYLSLAADADKIWKSFDPKVRNQIRKAEKSGIIVTDGRFELLDDFYSVYTIRMHQLGTPAYPRSIMKNILDAFADNSRIFAAKLGQSTIGAGFVTCYNGLVEIHWAATRVEYNNLCPNMLLYWSVIRHYCLAGARCFDFGRCTVDGPTSNFKKQWGAEPVPLHYQYWVRPGCKFSILSPDNPKYKRKVEIWKRLPLWMTRLIGPHISRNLP
jgi:FemAB-related protein (PEP-CTERM system-associated)